MPRRIPPMGDPTTDDEISLEHLERVVLRGQQALGSRNRLVAEMVARGVSQAHVTRRLNRVREQQGAHRLSQHAVAAILRREQARDREPG